MPAPKLTKARSERIVAAVRVGCPRHVAAAAAGVGKSTLQSWLARGEAKNAPRAYRDFAQNVRAADADAEIGALAVIRNAMGEDWEAASWFLEHARPGYAKRTEISGPDGEAIAFEGGWDISKLSDRDLASLQRLAEKASNEDEKAGP